MEKLRVLADTGIVIKCFEINRWETLINNFEVSISEKIIEESEFYEDDSGTKHLIDLDGYIKARRIQSVTVTATEAKSFVDLFAPYYSERFDAGELELMVRLHREPESFILCSGDGITFKTLSRLGLADRTVSLENLFGKIGMRIHLPYQFTESFADKCRKEGIKDMIQGFGMNKTQT